MKQYDFDEIVERKGTNSIKFDGLDTAFGRNDLIPLWVADMDFKTPDFIVDALKKRCEHELFGYTFASNAYYTSIIEWLKYKYLWNIDREWISYIPGIVKGIAFAVHCFTKPGDKIIIQPPVYHPFRIVPQQNGREVVYNPLILKNGTYEMDFDQLESVIDGCKMLILSNPHNPGGVVWSKETLQRLAEICHKNKVLVLSDEIHAEMTYPSHRHYPFASVSEAAAACSIVFMAPSKTFNIAGIVTSYAIVLNEKLRKQFYGYLAAGEFADGTIFAYEATIAAYTYGAEWLQQMRAYVMDNVDFVTKFLSKNIKGIEVFQPSASFLVWLDCRGLNLSHDALVDLFKNRAHLALNDGEMFGQGGEGFMRLNVGCPRSILEKSLEKLAAEVNKK